MKSTSVSVTVPRYCRTAAPRGTSSTSRASLSEKRELEIDTSLVETYIAPPDCEMPPSKVQFAIVTVLAYA